MSKRLLSRRAKKRERVLERLCERDRHGQNVFVSESGRLTILDNEGSFGPINSMLLPGGQKFEVYRIGYNAVCCGNLPGPDEVNCPGQ